MFKILSLKDRLIQAEQESAKLKSLIAEMESGLLEVAKIVGGEPSGTDLPTQD